MKSTLLRKKKTEAQCLKVVLFTACFNNLSRLARESVIYIILPHKTVKHCLYIQYILKHDKEK